MHVYVCLYKPGPITRWDDNLKLLVYYQKFSESELAVQVIGKSNLASLATKWAGMKRKN